MGAVGVTEGAGEDGDLLLIKFVLLFKSGVDFSPLVRRLRKFWQEYAI